MEEFLKFVHDVDISFMKEDKIMRNELEKLDMEKFIYTNGSADHAKYINSSWGLGSIGREKVLTFRMHNMFQNLTPKISIK